jgi:hypothetical protein
VDEQPLERPCRQWLAGVRRPSRGCGASGRV